MSLGRRRAAGMAAMAVLTAAASALNYASSLVFSRALEPVGFGELTSLLALSIVLAVPLGAAQTVVAERVSVAYAAGDHDRVSWLIRHAVGHVTTIGVVVTALYAATIPLVMSTLDIREPGPALALVPLVLVTFLNPVACGVLQGLERYFALGAVLFASAFSRLLFGAPWALAGGGAGGAIAGQACGMIVVLALVGWRLRRLVLPRGSGAARAGLRRRPSFTDLAASGAFIGFALLSNVDVLLARVYLDGHAAGNYAAIATVAKVVIFLPGAVTVIMVPRAARAHAGEGSSLRVLRLSALVTVGAVAACAIPATIAPGLIVRLMFGNGYEAAVDGVLPAVIAGGLLALLYLLCAYSVTIRDRRWVLLLVGGVALQAGLISAFHGSPTQIIWAQVATMSAVLLANELAFHSLLPLRRGGA